MTVEEEEKDWCENCIRMQDYSHMECPGCHGSHAQGAFEGPCLHIVCKECGFEVTGASFWAPCEEDNRKYHFSFGAQKLSKDQIVTVSRCMKAWVVEARKLLQEEAAFPSNFYLEEAMDISKVLEEQGISYAMIPKPCYGNYRKCQMKMRVKRIEQK